MQRAARYRGEIHVQLKILTRNYTRTTVEATGSAIM